MFAPSWIHYLALGVGEGEVGGGAVSPPPISIETKQFHPSGTTPAPSERNSDLQSFPQMMAKSIYIYICLF